jgi:hypothetical protein
MSLTQAQLTTLKTAILAETDASVVAARQAPADTTTIANFYNQIASPQVLLWKPVVKVDDLKPAVDWVSFGNFTVQKQNTWFAMCQGMTIDATSANIRNGFGAVFTGATLTALTAVAQRSATRFEALFTTSNVSSVFGQTVRDVDIEEALARG